MKQQVYQPISYTCLSASLNQQVFQYSYDGMQTLCESKGWDGESTRLIPNIHFSHEALHISLCNSHFIISWVLKDQNGCKCMVSTWRRRLYCTVPKHVSSTHFGVQIWDFALILGLDRGRSPSIPVLYMYGSAPPPQGIKQCIHCILYSKIVMALF